MNEKQPGKRPYVQPVLKRIELKVDEVLVGDNCKQTPCQSGNITNAGS